ncbi:hypothetical protein VC82_2483 [Flagellimonas lutaonensis]|uniref:Lipoprotein n=2 Tax=Flagellimonas lutaonensis TaxID=516051 RepID=A0A0D5YW38_9FLAO|nr:hypothetical protein VC82_2483 [Allomuricauda lutaonensis]
MVRLVFLILLMGMLSCKSQKSQQMADNTNDGLTLLVEDGYSGVENFESMVVRDQKTLNSFFAKINRTRKPGIPVPEVDFNKEMVIIVCSGEQKRIKMPRLSKKDENDKEIVLAVKNEAVDKNNLKELVSTPFSVYKIPMSEKEIIFQK